LNDLTVRHYTDCFNHISRSILNQMFTTKSILICRLKLLELEGERTDIYIPKNMVCKSGNEAALV